MEPHRIAVYATVAVVVAVAVASGPLVGAVDLTHERTDGGTGPEGSLGQGSVDVTVESLPGEATLDRSEYGAAAYTLRVPDARVVLSNVTGQPMVVYKLKIPAMGYTSGTVHFVTAEHEGAFTLELERDSLAPDGIDRDRYEGTLTVLVRADGERIVAREPITVVVRD